MGGVNAYFYTSEKDGKTACFWTRSRWERSAEMKVAKVGAPDWTSWTGGKLDRESLQIVANKFEPDYLYVTEEQKEEDANLQG